VDPCQDFFHYSCGNWIRMNPIPADQPRWDVYAKLQVDNQRFLWGILSGTDGRVRSSAGQPGRTPNEQKIGDYFGACMLCATGGPGRMPTSS
jgi:putative endopeptidase